MYGIWIFAGATVIAVVAIVVTMLDDDDVHPTALSASPRQDTRDRASAPLQPRLGASVDADMGPRSMVMAGRKVEVDAISIFTAASLTAAVATEVTGADDDRVHTAASSYRPMATAGTKTDAISIFTAVSVIAAVGMAVTRRRNR